MNKAQKTVFAVAIVTVLCMALYPPWVNQQSDNQAEPMGYSFIWKPPTVKQEDNANLFGIQLSISHTPIVADSIDFSRLIMQYAVLAIVTVSSMVLLGKSRQPG